MKSKLFSIFAFGFCVGMALRALCNHTVPAPLPTCPALKIKQANPKRQNDAVQEIDGRDVVNDARITPPRLQPGDNRLIMAPSRGRLLNRKGIQ